jgi:hypothetical protein
VGPPFPKDHTLLALSRSNNERPLGHGYAWFGPNGFSLLSCSFASCLAKAGQLHAYGGLMRARPAPAPCHQAGGELEPIQSLLGVMSVQTTERYRIQAADSSCRE